MDLTCSKKSSRSRARLATDAPNERQAFLMSWPAGIVNVKSSWSMTGFGGAGIHAGFRATQTNRRPIHAPCRYSVVMPFLAMVLATVTARVLVTLMKAKAVTGGPE